MATNALIIAVKVEGEDLPGEQVISDGLVKLADALRTTEALQAFLGKGTTESHLIVLKNLTGPIKNIDVCPDDRESRMWNHCVQYTLDRRTSHTDPGQHDEVLREFLDGVFDIVDEVE